MGVSAPQVHYELFTRRGGADGWTLHGASEERASTVAEAEALLAEGRVAAVRVVKETYDPQARAYDGVVILTRGEVAPAKRRTAPAADGPACTSPTDLYAPHARETLARLLEPWLARLRVTVFELLHRPDLAEALDREGFTLLHAIQKAAAADVRGRALDLHQTIRAHQALARRAVDRLAADARRFPRTTAPEFAALAERLVEQPDAGYLLGAAVARLMGEAPGWADKCALLADLAERAPGQGRARALALRVLEQPLGEILGGRAGLEELAGDAPLDPGGGLALLARLATGRVAALVAAADPDVMAPVPPVCGLAARLAVLLDVDAFEGVRAAMVRRMLAELHGPRRLRPADPEGEIELLRALAAVLAAAAGPRLSLEDVRAAFVERSRRLVAADFVERFLAGRGDPVAEARALVRLAENVTGAANKREVARWIRGVVDSLRFEAAVRRGPDAPGAKLAALADLQRALLPVGLPEAEAAAVAGRVGEAGGWVEADARLVHQLARSPAPAVTRAVMLARMAAGEAGPRGPAADRARAELLKLLRSPELRTDAAAHPEALGRLRQAMAACDLAA